MTNKLANIPSPQSLIEKALESKADIVTLEKLFALQERWEANLAKKDFVVGLAEFQKDCPVIEKKKAVMNKDGTTVRYKFAPLGDIVEQIKGSLSKNGLSYTWQVENDKEAVHVSAKITHTSGHSEVSKFTVPVDVNNQFMTQPQKYASALTFAKRYALCNALGISTGEEDTDATDVGKEPDPKSLKSQIMIKLRTLDLPNETKEDVETSVKKATKLTLVEKNYSEITARLQVLIDERNGDNYENS